MQCRVARSDPGLQNNNGGNSRRFH